MREGFIIFREDRPQSREDVCSSIEHFCKNHDFEYQFRNKRWPVKFSMEGEDYETEIKKQAEDAQEYWIICHRRKTEGDSRKMM